MEQAEYICAVQRNSQRLFLLALSFTHSHADAEDILQDVFCKLWQQTKPFENDTHIDKFLTRVCVNACRNHLRTLSRRREVPPEDAMQLYTFDTPADYDLFCAVASLPTRERTVVHLFYYEDMPVKEIAQTLRIGQSAVKTALCRARNHLKDHLKEDETHA